jgi:hypothetical protein
MFIDCSGLHPYYPTPPMGFAVGVQEAVMPHGFRGTSSRSREAVPGISLACGAQHREDVR